MSGLLFWCLNAVCRTFLLTLEDSKKKKLYEHLGGGEGSIGPLGGSIGPLGGQSDPWGVNRTLGGVNRTLGGVNRTLGGGQSDPLLLSTQFIRLT